MAEKRMFAKTIIDSDAFIDMPISARLLYYDLGMRADDDGFINSPKKIMKIIGATNDDMNILILRKFIIPFESGVVVIKHWRIHNYIRKDTYNETPYKKEKAMLEMDENKSYRLNSEENGIIVDDSSTQIRIDKISIDKNRLDKDSIDKNYLSPAEPEEEKEEKDKIPYKEIIEYLNQKTNSHYKSTSVKTRKQIHARYEEGFTLDDFKKVIDMKVAEWTGTEFEMYLRPETLFGTKLEWYLNQKKRKKSKGEVMDTLEAIYNGTIRIK